MVRVLTKLLLTIPIALSSVLAGDYYVSRRPVFSTEASVSHFTPLRTSDGAVAGFVIAETESNRIVVDGSYRWNNLALEPGSPVCAIAAQMLGDEDSLAVYIATAAPRGVTLTRYVVSDYPPVSARSLTFDFGFERDSLRLPDCSIRFVPSIDESGDLVALSVVETVPAREGTQDRASVAFRQTYFVTPDLDRQARELQTAVFRVEQSRFITVDDGRSRGAIWPELSLDTERDQYLHITDTRTGLSESDYRLPFTRIRQFETIDLTDRYESAEYLVLGSGGETGFERAAGADTRRLTALAEASGRVFELWREPFPGLTSVAPTLFNDHLVALRNHRTLLLLDPLSGFIADSVTLPEELEHVQYYRLKGRQGSLQLAGLASSGLLKVYRLDPPVASDATPENESEELPVTFEMLPSYPNPFNGSTQLRFVNKATQHLSLRIFNVLGQEVAAVIESVLPPGEYDYTWDATDNIGKPQPTGIYFAQLKSETESHIIKLIYLK